MIFKQNKLFLGICAAALVFSLAGCSGYSEPKPLPLGPAPHALNVQSLWHVKFASSEILTMKAVGNRVAIATKSGVVAVLDAATGKKIWEMKLPQSITAGAGFDGKVVAVVTGNNQVTALEDGKTLWQYQLQSLVLTPPLVAGERVFVLAADRSLSAFDATTGANLWSEDNPATALVLNSAGLLTSFGNTLVAGIGGDLHGYDPTSGSDLWAVRISAGRSGSDVERLVDVVDGATQNAMQMCVRTFQSSVACVDLAKQSIQWEKKANGFTGLAGNSKNIFGSNFDGRVSAWNRLTGQHAWTNKELLNRKLTMPVVLNNAVVVGDNEGVVYFLATENGSQLARLKTDSSAIKSPPIKVGDVLLIATSGGSVFGYKPN